MLRTGLQPIIYGHCPEAHRVFEAFIEPPTAHRRWLGDRLIRSQKTPGTWFKLDIEYTYAEANQPDSLINWKNPSVYYGTAVNSPTFTVDAGFTGAATKYISSNFNPTTAVAPNFVQDSACCFAHSVGDCTLSDPLLGYIANANMAIYPHYADGNAYGRINDAAAQVAVASADATGMWNISRSGASAQEMFKNGISVGTNAGASSAQPNVGIAFLSAGFGYYTGQISSAGLGKNLPAADQVVVYNSVRARLTAIGVP